MKLVYWATNLTHPLTFSLQPPFLSLLGNTLLAPLVGQVAPPLLELGEILYCSMMWDLVFQATAKGRDDISGNRDKLALG